MQAVQTPTHNATPPWAGSDAERHHMTYAAMVAQTTGRICLSCPTAPTMGTLLGARVIVADGRILL
jgi:hypothetical protein